MRIVSLGHLLLALGLIGFGALNLIYGDFGLNWQPVPAWIPARVMLAWISGVLLIAGGVGLLLVWAQRLAALVMLVNFTLWVLVLQAPRILLGPSHIGAFLGTAESLGLLAGTLVLYAGLGGGGTLVSGSGAQIGRILFGVACLEYGLSHFGYARFTASMIPSFMPARIVLAYITGAAHIAAGLGLIFFVLPRLAATLEAVMMSSFVLLVHIPGVLGAPEARVQWTMLAFATMLTGAAWIIAWSLRDQPWRFGRT
jgi:uncharacterized membrane protein